MLLAPLPFIANQISITPSLRDHVVVVAIHAIVDCFVTTKVAHRNDASLLWLNASWVSYIYIQILLEYK